MKRKEKGMERNYNHRKNFTTDLPTTWKGDMKKCSTHSKVSRRQFLDEPV